jgi:glycosyltransferase involved in cell wall biosynthesis
MKSDIKVSIITPCLNSEKTIKDTIESVLHQTYPDIEYIIVDGLSKDNTVNIIKSFKNDFKGRMRYVSEKDNGIYNAMNKGIKMSTGDIIGIVNSDDYYENDAVEKILKYSDPSKYRVVYGYMNLIKNNRIDSVCIKNHKNLDKEMITHSTCFLSRRIYQKYGLFLEWFKMAADYELMLRLMEKNDVEFIQVKDIISNFRLGGTCFNKKHFIESDLAKVMHGKISYNEFIKKSVIDLFENMLWGGM